MKNPIAFALDVPTDGEAYRLVEQLHEHVGAFKIGLELFIGSHRGGWMPDVPNPIILDLKLHDIPETVARAVKAGGDLGVQYMTLHVQQPAAMEKAVEAAQPYGIKLLGVTVLTSMVEEDLRKLGHAPRLVEARVKELARLAMVCGVHGLVCSPEEVAKLKTLYRGAVLLVPGIRPELRTQASGDDQRRVGTPSQALRDGADMIVVGRPIRDAADPVQAAQQILEMCMQGRELVGHGG